MDEKRFPPPDDEVGYREAAPPASERPEPEAHPSARHVLASRPDDPDLALQKAAIEDTVAKQNARVAEVEAQQQRVRRVGRVLVAVAVAGALVLLEWLFTR